MCYVTQTQTSMKYKRRRFATSAPLAPVLLLVALASLALSQIAGAGTVTGTLTDTSGAVVPEAQIVVHNDDTGVDRQVSTNGAGIYVAPFLQPGHYEISATKAGFVKVVRKGLTLQVGQTLTIDLSLSLQTTQETVAVTAAAPVVDVEKTEVSQVVSENLVDNLPLVGRRWDNFVLLTPAVTTDGNSVSFRGISSL